MPLFGPPNVRQLQDKKDVQGLIKALGYQKDAQVRARAAVALGQLGDTRALEPLLALFQDNNWFVLRDAACGLGKLKDRRAVAPLIAIINIRAMQNEVKWIQEAAAEALGSIGEKDAVGPLIELHQFTNGINLLRFQQREGVSESSTRLLITITQVLGRLGDGRVAEPLLFMLKSPGYMSKDHENMKTTVQEALVKIRDDQVVETLMEALMDSTPVPLDVDNEHMRFVATYTLSQMRATVAKTLGKIRDTRAVESLIETLKDSDIGLRRIVAEVLGDIGDTRAVEPLIEALKSDDIPMRGFAAEALGKLKDARAIKPLVAMIEDSDAKQKVKELIQADYPKAGEQFHLIGTISTPGGATLNSRWEPWLIATKALGQLGNPEVVTPLLKITNDEMVADAAIDALRNTLVHMVTNIATEELRSVLRLDKIQQFNLFITLDRVSNYSKDVDCSQVKLLAQQELVRRGLEI